jgi:hypothetical protein
MRRRLMITAAIVALVVWCAGTANATTGWVIQPTPNPAANGSDLVGVSCASATSCTAVGYYFGVTPSTLAEYWNGSTWAIQATPTPASGGALHGVSCTSATSCTAVGQADMSTGGFATLAEYWNGTVWAVQATPNPPGSTDSYLLGVSCASATSCTAVGQYSNGSGPVTLAEYWNGTVWAVQATPNPAGSTDSYQLNGVSCASATSCTAVGQGANDNTDIPEPLAEYWNGSTWAIQPTPNPSPADGSSLEGVSCTSATSCTAAGGYSPSFSTGATLAEYWNGSTWTVQTTPNPAAGGALEAISCPSSHSCTATGSNLDGNRLLAEHWNGSTWAIQPTPHPAGVAMDLLGVSCTSPTNCTAAGWSRRRDAAATTLVEAR